jgi:hypothetical protein
VNTPTKVYLAARYHANAAMRQIRDQLVALDYEVTSRWIDLDPAVVGVDGMTTGRMNADPSACAPYAQADVDDLMAADTAVFFTGFGPSSTGGRHVELGIALAAGKAVAVVGPRENIFMTLPRVVHYAEWADLLQDLRDAQVVRHG